MKPTYLFLALLIATATFAQDLRDPLFGSADTARQEAMAAQAEDLAPRTFAAAEDSYQNAVRDFERGGNLNRIRDNLTAAIDGFRAATAFAAISSEMLASLIRAREAARGADAYLHAADSWRRGEDRFRDAMLALERDDGKLAVRRGEQAEEHYRAAELTAIKATVLFEVRAELARADRERANRYAPRTLARAQSLLAEAETSLTEDRYDTDRPRGLAREALREARHAIHLAGLVKAARDEDRSIEDLILDFENHLGAIANAAEVTPAFEEGYAAVATTLATAVQADRGRIRALEQDVADRNGELLALEAQMDELDQRLGGMTEERRELAMRLEAQAEVRRRFDEIGAMFNRDDGEVLRDGNQVILRLSGLTFPVGRADLNTGHEPLLAKIRRALNLLPPREVVVEGHTDSYGSDAVNYRLSEERANALRQHILDTMPIAPNRVLAVGYGETRPVANNETAVGRARNRRIDIVIKPDLPEP